MLYGAVTYSQDTYSSQGFDPNAKINLVGVSATAVAGNPVPTIIVPVQLTNVVGTGQIGNTIIADNVVLNLEGFSASGELSTPLVWGLITDDQDPQWEDIDS